MGAVSGEARGEEGVMIRGGMAGVMLGEEEMTLVLVMLKRE